MPASKPNQKPQSATLVAMHKLRELIFSGDLVAGSNHLESELADRLNMSRTPVREATLMLEAAGLLEVQPRKGVRIKAISIRDMSEIYEVLTELESLAARKAAEANFNKADLAVLLESIDDMESALTREDREAWASADEAFHDELVRLGGNLHIETIVKNVNDQVRRARSFTLHMRPLPLKSNKDHKALYRAILKGDADKAQELHRQHRQNASVLLIKLLEKTGLKGL